jgi:hypothetical protein
MHGLLLIYLAILSYSDRFVPHSIVWSWAPKRNQAVAIAIGVQQRTRAALVTSALGPSRPNWAVRAMSGLPPDSNRIADIPDWQLRANSCRVGPFRVCGEMMYPHLRKASRTKAFEAAATGFFQRIEGVRA